jgi:hypothetical protein
MTRGKLDKLKLELSKLRRGRQRAAALESLAKKLGRKQVNRGKEPVWVSRGLPGTYPLSIPRHGGRDLSPGVQRSVLDILEGDIAILEEQLSDEESAEELKEEIEGDDDGDAE